MGFKLALHPFAIKSYWQKTSCAVVKSENHKTPEIYHSAVAQLDRAWMDQIGIFLEIVMQPNPCLQGSLRHGNENSSLFF